MRKMTAVLFILLGLMFVNPRLSFAGNPSNKFIYVLLDCSTSTVPKNGESDPYRQTLGRIMDSLKPGDRLWVVKITDRSMVHYEPICQYDCPEFNVFTDAKFKFEKQTKNARKELEEKLDYAFVERKNSSSTKTDIFSSLILASQYLREAKNGQEKVLIILSDMLEDSEEFNFERTNLLAEGRTDKIIRQQKQIGGLPDLSKVQVWVSGAKASSNRKMLSVKVFWLKYFAETGAALDPDHYMPLIVNFDF